MTTGAAMEGILWKWTNYFTGWQPRWFVLDTGILSYYKSQEDVNNGCKGSIKMSVCDVSVHPTDNTRLDLIIPGEAHFYVKSATPQERQQWLVALGSCKACLRNGKKTIIKEEMSEDTLRAKKSELRLYCDLLMQQVHSVKTAIHDQPEVKQQLNEATSLLSATCDTFISTLEDCVRLANADAPYPPASPAVVDATLPPSPLRRANSQNKQTPNSRPTAIQRSTSSDSRNSISGGSPLVPNDVHSADTSNGRGHINKGQRSARSSISRSRTPSESSEVSTSEKDPKDRLHLDQTRNSVSPAKTKPDIAEESDEDQGEIEVHHTPPSSPAPHATNGHRIETMFSKMSVSFMDIKLDKDGGIPVEAFLEACDNVLLIFDKLSPTAFAPIKMDISGNVKKIQQKYSTDRENFATLQKIVLYEVEHEQHKNGNSATISLVWLKRAMMFIREFLAEVHAGEVELEDCAYNAYQRTLRQFHGFVIRGVFAVAVKSVPYRKDFLIQLVHFPEDAQRAGYVDQVLSDIDDYVTAQGVLIKIIDDYLTSQGIDVKTVM